MKTIQQKIEEKIGNNYEELFKSYIEKHPRSKRAFYILEDTYKIARNGAIYYTGLKIEKNKFGKIVAYQHRMTVQDSTFEEVK